MLAGKIQTQDVLKRAESLACEEATHTLSCRLPCTLDLNHWTVEELLYLLVFGVLEAKDGLDRTGVKIKIDKKGKIAECGPGCTSWICNACTCFGLLA